MSQFNRISQLNEYQLNDIQTVFLKNCENAKIELVNNNYIISIPKNDVSKENVKKDKKVKKVKKDKKNRVKKSYNMTPQLCDFLNVSHDTHMTYKEMIKRVSQYIVNNKLKNENKKHEFLLDEKLKTLFEIKNENENQNQNQNIYKFYLISKYIKNHILKEYVVEKCPAFKDVVEKCPAFKDAVEKCTVLKDAVEKCPAFKDAVEKCPYIHKSESLNM
jgi:chromatin remodeling complex protein RSC6